VCFLSTFVSLNFINRESIKHFTINHLFLVRLSLLYGRCHGHYPLAFPIVSSNSNCSSTVLQLLFLRPTVSHFYDLHIVAPRRLWLSVTLTFTASHTCVQDSLCVSFNYPTDLDGFSICLISCRSRSGSTFPWGPPHPTTPSNTPKGHRTL